MEQARACTVPLFAHVFAREPCQRLQWAAMEGPSPSGAGNQGNAGNGALVLCKDVGWGWGMRLWDGAVHGAGQSHQVGACSGVEGRGLCRPGQARAAAALVLAEPSRLVDYRCVGRMKEAEWGRPVAWGRLGHAWLSLMTPCSMLVNPYPLLVQTPALTCLPHTLHGFLLHDAAHGFSRFTRTLVPPHGASPPLPAFHLPRVRLVLSYVQQPWFETPPAGILKIVTIMHSELDGYPFR